MARARGRTSGDKLYTRAYGTPHDDENCAVLTLPTPTDETTLDPADVQALLEVDKVTKKTVFELRQCQHCGGVHDRACPRVKRMVFSPTGSLLEVEFWARWNDDYVIYPEMLGVIPTEVDGG